MSDSPQAEPIDDAWIRHHYPRVHRTAWLMTGDAWESEDLAQETMIIAIKRISDFEGRSDETTWLTGILVRLIQHRQRSFARWQQRLRKYIHQSSPRVSEDPPREMAYRQWSESVWAEVAGLPTEQRLAVSLRFAESLTFPEIGRLLDCSVATAKSRVRLGLEKLNGPRMQALSDLPMTERPHSLNSSTPLTLWEPHR